jgi:hypothetical protein
MASFANLLGMQDVEDIHAYVISRAHEDWGHVEASKLRRCRRELGGAFDMDVGVPDKLPSTAAEPCTGSQTSRGTGP